MVNMNTPSDEFLMTRILPLCQDIWILIDSVTIQDDSLFCNLRFDRDDGEIDFAFLQIEIDYLGHYCRILDTKVYKTGRERFEDYYKEEPNYEWVSCHHNPLALKIINQFCYDSQFIN